MNFHIVVLTARAFATPFEPNDWTSRLNRPFSAEIKWCHIASMAASWRRSVSGFVFGRVSPNI